MPNYPTNSVMAHQVGPDILTSTNLKHDLRAEFCGQVQIVVRY